MPDWKDEIRKRLAPLKLSPVREAEIIEELSQHLEDRYRELFTGGASEEDARRAVLSELSDSRLLAEGLRRVERIIEQEPVVFGARRRNMIRDIWQDLRYSVRSIWKNPGFTSIAVLTLALGIGPITAIFTLAHAVLLKPLPFKEPERLAMVWKNTGNPSSVPDFVDWRDQNQVCEQMGAFSTSTFNLLSEGEPEAIPGAFVSAGMLAALGVEPMLGRWFLPNEDQPGGAPLVVLSHTLWQQRFGADPNIIDRNLIFDAKPYTVVGVMPQGFAWPSGVRLWATAPFDANDPGTPRGSNFLNIVARLKPGISIEQARTNLQTILQPQYPNQIQLNVVSLHEQLVGDTRTPLLVLLGAIAFVLLIACANVANLLLVRAAARQKEVAVRTALGASRFRLFRQLLTESLLLTATGGAVGLLLAFLSLDLLVSLSPIKIPRLSEVGIDGRVIGFLSSIVLLTGALLGTLSAFRLSEGDLREALKEGAGRATAGRTRQRLRSGLVVAEIGLSLVLLIGTGLMLRSFLSLRAIDPGFKPEGVLSVNLSLPQSRYPEWSQRAEFVRQAIERLEAMPQARSVASAAYIPLSGNYNSRRFAIQGLPLPEPGREPFANNTPVSPDYFRTLGMPLVAGRAFTVRDDIEAPGVAIVNQTFARRYFAGEEVIGKHIRFYSSSDPQPPWLEIVGVAGDIRQASLSAEARPEIYVPHAQSAWSFINFFVRTDGDPMSLVVALKSAIREIDKDQPVSSIATLDEVLADSIADRRGLMFLLGVFAAVALALATVGIYGVISHSVSQRTREIGIRLALGAQPRDVLKLILRQGLLLILAGLGLGLTGAIGLTRLMSDLLFEVSTTDLITFISVPLILTVVALMACCVPARRATRVDPMVALRYE
ncbi:MAG: ABC transporter permease [Blastocatellia bacterium]|nr:ABC transporter permease [Blastocatellia bacterium]